MEGVRGGSPLGSGATTAAHVATSAERPEGPAAAAQPYFGAHSHEHMKEKPDSRRRTMSNSFMILRYKVSMCKRTDPHNWRLCPYAHEGEAGRRRPPHTYQAVMCDSAKNKGCLHGESCPFARNALELWLHPDKYRTSLCGQGEACNRNICFFAHSPQELRMPGSDLPAKNTRAKSEAAAAGAADMLAQLVLAAGGSSQQLPQAQAGSTSSGGRGGQKPLSSNEAVAQQQLQMWMAQASGLQGVAGHYPAALAAAAAAAAGGMVQQDSYQLQDGMALQHPMQAVAGSSRLVMSREGQQASTLAAAQTVHAAVYDTIAQQQQQQQLQQQQVVSPTAQLARFSSVQEQPAYMQGVQDQPAYMQGVQQGVPHPAWGMHAAQAEAYARLSATPPGLATYQDASGQVYTVSMPMLPMQGGAQGVPGSVQGVPGSVQGQQGVWPPDMQQQAYRPAVSPGAPQYGPAWMGQMVLGVHPQQAQQLLPFLQQGGQAQPSVPNSPGLAMLQQGGQAGGYGSGMRVPGDVQESYRYYVSPADPRMSGGAQQVRQPPPSRGQ